MNRWDSFTNSEIRYLVALIELAHAEGVGTSGDNKSDRCFDRWVAAEAYRRGIVHGIPA